MLGYEREEFFVLYQPTFDLRTMVPTGMEALLRWRHPRRGVVQPDDFIPLLEDTGLIVEVGRWVLDEACRQAAVWREGGHEIGIAVNVSARQLDRDEFVQEVAAAIERTGIRAELLTLEVTETTIMSNAEVLATRSWRTGRRGRRRARACPRRVDGLRGACNRFGGVTVCPPFDG